MNDASEWWNIGIVTKTIGIGAFMSQILYLRRASPHFSTSTNARSPVSLHGLPQLIMTATVMDLSEISRVHRTRLTSDDRRGCTWQIPGASSWKKGRWMM